MLIRELDDELLVLDTVADRIHRLNASAAVIWRMRDGGAANEDIARVLVDRFDVTLERAIEDVDETVGTLRELGLLDRDVSATVLGG